MTNRAISAGWVTVNNKLKKEFKFKDFKQAMAFVAKVADLAETENHHPDIHLVGSRPVASGDTATAASGRPASIGVHIFYNRVIIELWTHSIRGLSEKDFSLAGKIEKL